MKNLTAMVKEKKKEQSNALLIPGGFKPTEEQEKALDLFASGRNLAIEAGAGTGKTSTLSLLSQSNRNKGQYIAFNKAIVEDSKGRMSSNVKCSTAHSLAYGAIMKDKLYKERLAGGRQRPADVAKFLGLQDFICYVDGHEKVISSEKLSIILNNMIYRFCTSADETIWSKHMVQVDGLDGVDPDGGKQYKNHNVLAQILVPIAQKAWDDISNPNGTLQFKHEHYLKLWHLSDPVINVDYILFDEAQDANPVMYDTVSKQDCQLVFVGDSAQAIYEFTGAVNAMASIPYDNKAHLTKSFRFGQAVADVANNVLDLLDADLRVVGFDQIESEIVYLDNPNALLVRSNAGAISAIIDGLMAGKKVAYVGNVNEIISFVRACADLQAGRGTMHPELMCFSDWNEVVMYSEMNEDDKTLQLMVKLITQYSAATIISNFKKLVDESRADVVISTAHKAKGREWDSVQLGRDFGDNLSTASEAEQRLMYVAVTRAKRQLDVSNIPHFDSFYGD